MIDGLQKLLAFSDQAKLNPTSPLTELQSNTLIKVNRMCGWYSKYVWSN